MYERNFNFFNMDEFKNDLNFTDWDQLLYQGSIDIDNAFDSFYNTVNLLLDDRSRANEKII